LLKSYDELPKEFHNEEVKKYYDILKNKKRSIILKRITDIILALMLIIVLSIPMLIIAFFIKISATKGPVFYKQERVTTYGKVFKILKFRTMIVGADQCGELLTKEGDERVTLVGRALRKYRLDELPQIFHVLTGKMSIVGTRPEVPKYVNKYSDEYYATLLLPAGITSFTSIKYKDEDKLLKEGEDVDKIYIERILPDKMRYNLKYLKRFGFRRDLFIMLKTVKEVFKR
jgi:lipopolysaccharide/colanic/teichoic acid biosynthesis glycosyltransferase